ncbi:DNA topoisomerase [Psychrobacter sp. I-STPA10]|uniref:DNA topoisomerase n=1 Tax=Psychrobacter sp. I-STPA10 TaxID=2585769 RepID=UPI001E45F29C|nr:DNA topoisomerase [Psychrobacter sp. I-STPA10]
MKNSAHDDISIIDNNALEYISDTDMRNIYQLIADMQLSEELGCAHLMQQKLRLELEIPQDKTSMFVNLQGNMTMTEGWLAGPLAAFFNGTASDFLTHEDIDAIKNGDFQMQVDLCDESENLSLTELLHHMDIFEVGRPSTAAAIIEDLIQKSELIEISTEGDCIKMTAQGHEAYQVLQTHLASVANVEWNSWFVSQLSQIEAGKRTADSLILDVLNTLYGKQAVDALKHLSWSDPDVLYEPAELTQSIGKIAISRKHEQTDHQHDRQSRQNQPHQDSDAANNSES